MRRLFISVFCFASVASSAQFKNIKLAEETEGRFPPMSPSIAINSKDPKNIIAGISLSRAVYSLDGGNTWNESILTSQFGVIGDPQIISDPKGHLYYFHLADPSGQGQGNEAWLDRIVCQKSEDGGKTWNVESFIGNNPPKDLSKHRPGVHPKKQIIYSMWTQFDKYGSQEAKCHSSIMFSVSTNAGSKWGKPVQVNQAAGDCADGDNTVEGSMPAIAMDGRIFVTWANKGVIFFDRSYDGGKTFLTNDLAIAKQTGGWSLEIPGFKRSNGLPVLRVDNSQTRAHGSLYIVYADQRNGLNDTDIWFIRSTNRGDNWAAPYRVNLDEPGKHQFMPSMAVDHTTGILYIIYYDRRAYNDLQTDVYIACSLDGGNTFRETKISETPFIPTDTKLLGDYINIAADAGTITPIWTRMDDGKTSVWTAVIKDDELLKQLKKQEPEKKKE